MIGTLLTLAERDRLVELVDLLNDLSVTQVDRHESVELARLWHKLTHDGYEVGS